MNNINLFKVSYGNIPLTEELKELKKSLNREIITLCRELPPALQNRAVIFFMKYCQNTFTENMSFFHIFYTPTWSPLYHLVKEKPQFKEQADQALTAQAMAMLLHLVDDYLVDKQEPTDNLMLQLRTQAWNRYRGALDFLCKGIEGGEEIIETSINTYFSSIHEPDYGSTLDGFLKVSRLQCSTWVPAPLLLACHSHPQAAPVIKEIYREFFLSWRIIDDIQDFYSDLTEGLHTSFFSILTEEEKLKWKSFSLFTKEEQTEFLKEIFHREYEITLAKRAWTALERARQLSLDAGLPGLADEFTLMNSTVAEFLKEREILSLEITTRCNLSCRDCFALTGIEAREDVSHDTALSLAREGFELGFRTFHITGGEPFLWPRLFEFLKELRALGYEKIIMNTNGTLLSKEVSRKLAPFKEMLLLTCSINGLKQHHELVRGEKSFHTTLSGIKNALKEQLCVDIFTVADRGNLTDLPGLTDFLLKELTGINRIIFIQKRKTSGRESTGDLLTPKDFAVLVRITAMLQLKGDPVYILENPLANVLADKMGFTWFSPSEPINRKGKIIVLQGGEVTANHSSRDIIAHYSPGSLSTILSSKEYRESFIPDFHHCPPCPHHSSCYEASMLLPSCDEHNNEPGTMPFCQKVLVEEVV